MNTAPQPKPWIAGIHAYVPGKSAGADGRPLVKLSANENPLGCSPRVLTAIDSGLGELALYPDGNGFVLKAALAEAKYEGLPDGFRVTASIGVAHYEREESITALIERGRTGRGKHIDVSMLEAVLATMGWAVSTSNPAAP